MDDEHHAEPPTGDGMVAQPTAGLEPMTAPQRTSLEAILRGTGQPVPERLTSAEASDLIARLGGDEMGGSNVG